jgi:predicted O-methyltransferase YrrM
VNSVVEYIKYRWNAKKRHGIHSPFVYDLADKCLTIKPEASFIKELNFLDKKLKSDERLVNVLDAGAGSRHFGSQRKVKDIYRISSSKGFNSSLLYRLARYFKPAQVLELGTSLGIGTICLANAHPDSMVLTVEACPETLAIAKENFQLVHKRNIHTVNSTFHDFLNDYSGGKFDLIFVDGHHDGDAMLNYLERLNEFSHDNTIFVLDDIRWSDSMKSAFDQLIGSDRYHVTIDLFRTGIILKRPNQVKEHFILRF